MEGERRFIFSLYHLLRSTLWVPGPAPGAGNALVQKRSHYFHDSYISVREDNKYYHLIFI